MAERSLLIIPLPPLTSSASRSSTRSTFIASGQSLVVYSVDRELVRLTPGISPQVSAVVVEFHSIPIVIGGLSTYGFIAFAFSARAVASRISAAATSGRLRIAEYLSVPSLTATVSTAGRGNLAATRQITLGRAVEATAIWIWTRVTR